MFGLKLALPKGIFVEDFKDLNVDNPSMYGFCNLAPTKLKKNSDEITPSRIIFFNSFKQLKIKLYLMLDGCIIGSL